eukprot:858726-Amphidinium_carterae.1
MSLVAIVSITLQSAAWDYPRGRCALEHPNRKNPPVKNWATNIVRTPPLITTPKSPKQTTWEKRVGKT